jgi:hypothetical protein
VEFDGDGALFRLASEAQRIRLAHLFDLVLAVHISLIEPLPHQITAVYEATLPRQPLRILLADDPGADKGAQRVARPKSGPGSTRQTSPALSTSHVAQASLSTGSRSHLLPSGGRFIPAK